MLREQPVFPFLSSVSGQALEGERESGGGPPGDTHSVGLRSQQKQQRQKCLFPESLYKTFCEQRAGSPATPYRQGRNWKRQCAVETPQMERCTGTCQARSSGKKMVQQRDEGCDYGKSREKLIMFSEESKEIPTVTLFMAGKIHNRLDPGFLSAYSGCCFHFFSGSVISSVHLSSIHPSTYSSSIHPSNICLSNYLSI